MKLEGLALQNVENAYACLHHPSRSQLFGETFFLVRDFG
jgi:hypothetical protein